MGCIYLFYLKSNPIFKPIRVLAEKLLKLKTPVKIIYMPKSFVYFLALVQTIVLIGHVALFASLMFFFPFLEPYHVLLLIALIILAVSFLGLSFAIFKIQNPILRIFYILSAIWIPTWFYLLLAAAISLLIFLIFPAVSLTIYSRLIFGAAILLSLYGIVNAIVIRVIRIKVQLPNLPVSWRGKKAVMVSDLHLGHVLREGFAKKVIGKINSLNPEIVFIPGDFFDGAKTDFRNLASLFRSLKSTFGTYYVSGNHEQYAGYQDCEDAISAAGIHILENRKVEINGLQVAGLAYFSESQETAERAAGLLKSMELDPLKPSILLKHVPNNITTIANAGISLQLSGHTHLGQIWPGRYITRKIYKGFDYGFKKLNNFQIYTSSGAGTWGPPMKVFTKSEIVEITFV